MDAAAGEIDKNIARNASERFEIISDFVERKFLSNNHQVLHAFLSVALVTLLVQLVSRCFQAWRDLGTKARIQAEKALVWFEWRNARKVFRAWHLHSRNSLINRMIDMDQHRIKLLQMWVFFGSSMSSVV